jgi:hypothetical protein
LTDFVERLCKLAKAVVSLARLIDLLKCLLAISLQSGLEEPSAKSPGTM